MRYWGILFVLVLVCGCTKADSSVNTTNNPLETQMDLGPTITKKIDHGVITLEGPEKIVNEFIEDVSVGRVGYPSGGEGGPPPNAFIPGGAFIDFNFPDSCWGANFTKAELILLNKSKANPDLHYTVGINIPVLGKNCTTNKTKKRIRASFRPTIGNYSKRYEHNTTWFNVPYRQFGLPGDYVIHFVVGTQTEIDHYENIIEEISEKYAKSLATSYWLRNHLSSYRETSFSFTNITSLNENWRVEVHSYDHSDLNNTRYLGFVKALLVHKITGETTEVE